MNFVLIAWGRACAPRLETPVTAYDHESALIIAEIYSQYIANRSYWNFALDVKDGETVATWICDVKPTTREMLRHV